MIDKHLYELIRPIVSKYIDFENDIIEITKYLVKEKRDNDIWNRNKIQVKLLGLSPNSSYFDIDRIITETENVE